MSLKNQKWGSSFAIRIPKSMIKKMNLKENSEVEVEQKNGTIVIFPAQMPFAIETLLDQISKSNLHHEEDFKVEGGEIA